MLSSLKVVEFYTKTWARSVEASEEKQAEVWFTVRLKKTVCREGV